MMRATTMMLNGTLLATLGCASGELNPAPEQTKVLPAAPAPAAPAPVDLQLELDTLNGVVAMGVRGAKGDRVEGVLTDAAGRRALRYVREEAGVEGGEVLEEVEALAEGDWHLPPAAAVDDEGNRAVCYNRLVGEKQPDLDAGFSLHCRVDSGGGWTDEVQPVPDIRAPWLADVTALGEGRFRVVYHPAVAGLLDEPGAGQPNTFYLEPSGKWREP